MSLEIILAKRRRRYLERVWRRTRFPLDRSRYNKQLHIIMQPYDVQIKI